MIERVKKKPEEKWDKVFFSGPTKTKTYWVSSFGRIKSVDKVTGNEKLIEGGTVTGGYKTLNVKLQNDKTETILVHNAIAEAFLGRKPAGAFLIHKNKDRADNRLANLQYVTKEQRDKHLGPKQNYEGPGNMKLDESKVRSIKAALRRGRSTHKVLAKRFDVSVSTIRHIQSGKKWAKVVV